MTKFVRVFLVFVVGGLLSFLPSRLFLHGGAGGFLGVEALEGLKGGGGSLGDVWSFWLRRGSKILDVVREFEESKRLELKFGRPHWQHIQETEELARAS